MLKTWMPFVDLRGKTPVDLLRAYPDKAQAIIRSARGTWGIASQAASGVLLPWADKKSQRWLARTGNPYLHDIEDCAHTLGTPGLYMLNLAYEWGCTGGAYKNGDTVSLLRLLDWPFPELGRHAMVVRQEARAGDFYQVTWPGMVGVTTAMAPGRFSVALHLAPMRSHGRSFAVDWWKNRRLMHRAEGWPPSHLLRQVCEQAESYAAAKQLLCDAPLAVPAIFVLTGIKAGEGCVIERIETNGALIEMESRPRVSAANHFSSKLSTVGSGWRPRMVNSQERWRQATTLYGNDLMQEHFDWLQPPMLNSFTRLAVVADAATGRLVAQGFDGVEAATHVFSLPQEASDSRKDIVVSEYI